MSIKEDFNQLHDMVATMETQLKMFSDMTDSTITNIYGLDLDIKKELEGVSKEDIENMEDHQILRILNSSSPEMAAGETESANVAALKKSQEDEETYKDKPFVDYAKFVLSDIVNSLEQLAELTKSKDKIVKDANDAYNNYFDYINSPEYKEKMLARLAEMKEEAAQEEDPTKRRKIEAKIDAMEKSKTLEFLLTRLEEYPDKEPANIVDVFFNETRSNMVMAKFKSRMKQYGYNQDLYKRFFNLEEQYLTPDFAPLNNIFLFHVMRWISFTNPSDEVDSLFVNSVLVAMYNLVYHKYDSMVGESEFVTFMRKVDTYFLPFKEKFEKFNTTAPGHPERIKREAEYEQKRRMMLIASLENAGVEFDASAETSELYALLRKVMEEKQKVEDDEGEPDSAEVYNADESSEEDDSSDSDAVETESDGSEEEETVSEDTEETDSEDIEVSEEANTEDVESEEDIEVSEDDPVFKVTEEAANVLEERPGVDIEDVETEDGDKVFVGEDDGEKHPTIEATADDIASLVDSIAVETDVYEDPFHNYYVEDPDNPGTYKYIDKTGEILEPDASYSEEDILRLRSAGKLFKTTIII
jgi:hypothetical protein